MRVAMPGADIWMILRISPLAPGIVLFSPHKISRESTKGVPLLSNRHLFDFGGRLFEFGQVNQ